MLRRCFTLIEMLVVIAIIATLAAMLSPALQRAMKRARGVNCTSQMRGMGAAYDMYVGDWNGFYPPANMQAMSEGCFRMGWEKTFPHFLGAYMGYPEFHSEKYGSWETMQKFRKSPFMCTDYPYDGELSMFRGGYGVNIRCGSYEKNASNSWNGVGICHRASSIKSPGNITHLGERWGDFHLGVDGVTVTDIANHRSASMDLQRHLDGCNILFFDGHCKWYTGVSVVLDFDKAYRLGGTTR